MSFIVSAVALTKVAGSPAKKSVLMYMAARASDDGSGIWSSKANMAADMEISRRTVQRSICELMDDGVLLEVGERACKNGFTVEYSIAMDVLSVLPNTRDTLSPVSPRHPDTCHPVTSTRDTLSPKQSLEQSNEQSFIGEQAELLPVEPSKPKRKPKRLECHLPDDWVPSDRNIQDAMKLNLSQQDIDHEAYKFLNSAKSNGRKQLDWDAAWRVWIARSLEFKRGNGPARNGSSQGNFQRIIAAAAQGTTSKDWG